MMRHEYDFFQHAQPGFGGRLDQHAQRQHVVDFYACVYVDKVQGLEFRVQSFGFRHVCGQATVLVCWAVETCFKSPWVCARARHTPRMPSPRVLTGLSHVEDRLN